MNDIIPFAIPDISEQEINAVSETLKEGYLTSGPKAAEFENQFKQYVGCSHALAVNSATSGLHLALVVLGIGPGDLVVVPVNTFTATANAISYTGATPVFCDIDEKTFNIDIGCLKNILLRDTDKRIKVVLPVHIAGQAADMNSIGELKKEYGFFIVEDAAHALPTTYHNRLIGTIGDITIFSFYPTKTLGTCDGGMICTENDSWAKKIRVLKSNGIDFTKLASSKMRWQYDVEELGYKYGMGDVAASLAMVQLARSEEFLRKREMIADYYDESFKSISSITTPYIANPSDIHSRHLYIIKIPKRDEVYMKLYEQGIMTSVHYKPLHLHSYWQNNLQLKADDFKTAGAVFEKALSLPIHTKLHESQVERIANSLVKILG
jgi:dTDP-4-amino-4,6-dideoxygalactose transaminase